MRDHRTTELGRGSPEATPSLNRPPVRSCCDWAAARPGSQSDCGATAAALAATPARRTNWRRVSTGDLLTKGTGAEPIRTRTLSASLPRRAVAPARSVGVGSVDVRIALA